MSTGWQLCLNGLQTCSTLTSKQYQIVLVLKLDKVLQPLGFRTSQLPYLLESDHLRNPPNFSRDMAHAHGHRFLRLKLRHLGRRVDVGKRIMEAAPQLSGERWKMSFFSAFSKGQFLETVPVCCTNLRSLNLILYVKRIPLNQSQCVQVFHW